MGGFLSTRQRNGVEEIDVITNHAYKYPPKSGNYFGTHFIMGGERFDTPQPESYLFGENSDLNFLGCRPIPFPYPPPQPNEPTKTLKCLVNIRKESLRFVRASSEYNKVSNTEDKTDDVEMGTNSSFNIEFTFDSDVKCAITIYYFSTEEITSNGVNFIPRDSQICSETFHYNRGADQQFCQPTHVFNPAKFMEDEFQFDIDKEIIPIAIYCVAEDGPEDMRQSHTTIATVDKIADGIFLLKALKQKLYVDGLCYLLQEIYGIENKNNEKITGDEETEDNGSECVICMCDVRDTLILPCRHLCLCFSCADSLRYQANNCPICRAPFRALLQIRALQKCSTPLSSLATAAGHLETICDNIPAGYEAVSLIEALNGPCQSTTTRHPPSAIPDLIESPENENAAQAARILNRQSTNFSQPSSPDFESKKIKSSSRSDCTDNPKEKNTYPLLKDEKETAMRLRNNSIKLNENDREENNDEDSEAEKLSPLLQKKRLSVPINVLSPISALCLDDDVIIDNIDESENINIENETCTRKKKRNKEGNFGLGDNSDYYTSSDAPAENFLYNEAETLENSSSSIESTPHKLPGTPLSIKSSGESYASGGSTKQLLAITKKTNSESVSVHV